VCRAATYLVFAMLLAANSELAVPAANAESSAPLAQSQHTEDLSPCGVPEFLADGWQIESQTSAGVDPSRLCRMIEIPLKKFKANVHSVIVLRRGSLLFEYYGVGPDQPWDTSLPAVVPGVGVKHDVHSVSKSVVSLLIGIALDRKLLASVDEPIWKFFPEFAAFRTAAKDRILLRHLLTMTSGIAWNEWWLSYADPENSELQMDAAPDPYRYVLEQPLTIEPGTKWNYSGGSTVLLGAILQKVTQKPLAEFAREALFEPLGITDFEWMRMSSGEIAADGGLRLRPRDMAKLGQLVLSQGEWKGKRIVSASWLRESLQKTIDAMDLHYGYQWWIGSSWVNSRTVEWFAALGHGGQRIIIVPSLDLVVIFTAGLYDSNDWALMRNLLEIYILPSIVRR
jgi:CubicO group peptidase (beta-lactamase class C family)